MLSRLIITFLPRSSVQFNHSVMSNSLWPPESQHARPPCPSPTPRVHSDSRPSSQWCHPAISSSVVPFSSCPQSLPASESFPVSQLFRMRWPKYWNFSFSIIPSKEQSGLISCRMDWLDLLAVHGTLKSLLLTPQFKSINSSVLSFLHMLKDSISRYDLVNNTVWSKSSLLVYRLAYLSDILIYMTQQCVPY